MSENNDKRTEKERIQDFYKDFENYSESFNNVSFFNEKTGRKRKKINNRILSSSNKNSIDFIIRFNISQDLSNKISEGISKIQKALDDLKSDINGSSK